MLQAMGGCCAICKYNLCPDALVAHHLDPDTKDFNLARCTVAWSRIVEELRKCVLLCNRCHTEVHAGLRVLPPDITRFDEAYAVKTPWRKPKELQHGKRHTYTYHKCRCSVCRAANTSYKASLRERESLAS